MNDWLVWLGGTLEYGRKRRWKWHENENGLLVRSFDIWEEPPPLPPPSGIFCPSCVCTACTLTFTHHSFLPPSRYQASFCTFSISPLHTAGEKIFRHVTLILPKLHFVGPRGHLVTPLSGRLSVLAMSDVWWCLLVSEACLMVSLYTVLIWPKLMYMGRYPFQCM